MTAETINKNNLTTAAAASDGTAVAAAATVVQILYLISFTDRQWGWGHSVLWDVSWDRRHQLRMSMMQQWHQLTMEQIFICQNK